MDYLLTGLQKLVTNPAGVLSFVKGGPAGLAIVDTLDEIHPTDKTLRTELEIQLCKWCMSTEYAELLESLRKGSGRLTAADCVKSALSAGVNIPDSESVFTILIKNLSARLSASDPLVSSRINADQFLTLTNLMTNINLKLDSSGFDAGTADPRQTGYLDAVKVLIDAEFEEAASLALSRLKDSDHKISSPKTLSRMFNMCGICALRFDELSVAADDFKLALNVDPANPHALSNLASTHYQLNQLALADELSEKAFNLMSENPKVAAVRILVLADLANFSAIEEIIQQHSAALEADTSSLLALADADLKQGKQESALGYSEKAFALEPENPQVLMLLVRAHLSPLQALLADPPFMGSLTADVVAQLEKCIGYLDQVVELSNKRSLQKFKVHALAVKAGLKLMMADKTSALECLRVALEIEPKHDLALTNLGRLHLVSNEFDSAKTELEKVSEHAAAQVSPLLGEAYFHLGELEKALQQFRVGLDSKLREKMTLCQRILELEFKVNGEKAASDFCLSIVEQYGSTTDAQQLKAALAELKGDLDSAIQVLKDAVDNSSGSKQLWLRHSLVKAMAKRGRYVLTTIETYKSLCEDTDNDEIWTEYIWFLCDHAQWFAAFKNAEELRKRRGSPIAGVTGPIEVGYLASDRRYAEAQSLLLEMREKQCFKVSDQLNLASITARLKDFELADKLLKQVKVEELSANGVNVYTEVKELIQQGQRVFSLR